MKVLPKWGVVRCAPDNSRIFDKLVCYNERNALIRGRDWKRRYPDQLVRVVSLLPGDTSPPTDIEFVPLARQYHRKPKAGCKRKSRQVTITLGVQHTIKELLANMSGAELEKAGTDWDWSP